MTEVATEADEGSEATGITRSEAAEEGVDGGVDVETFDRGRLHDIPAFYEKTRSAA